MTGRRRIAFAALVLALLGASLAEESFARHTDDGCRVETHCLACRLTTATTAVLSVPAPAVGQPAEHAEPVWTDAQEPHSVSAPVDTPSRAPPLV